MTYADVAFLIAQIALVTLAYWFGYRSGAWNKQKEYGWLLREFQAAKPGLDALAKQPPVEEPPK